MKTFIVTGRSRHRRGHCPPVAPYRLAAIANLAGNAGPAYDLVKRIRMLGGTASWRALANERDYRNSAHGAPCRLPP
jgi:hypothetical protein